MFTRCPPPGPRGECPRAPSSTATRTLRPSTAAWSSAAATRRPLARSREVFRNFGASLWAERAAEELGRLPIRRGAGTDLTPTEERVAALAAAGRTNREVAQALFMSPKTVEANLTRIYGKLGVRSRAELGARLLEDRGAALPAKK